MVERHTINLQEYMRLPKNERQKHLSLDEDCLERGGNSTCHKGVLAEFLGTQIPSGFGALLAHACHNGKCSNPKHLYWATPKENVDDLKRAGGFISIYQKLVNKYGLKQAKEILSSNAKGGNKRRDVGTEDKSDLKSETVKV